MRASQIPCVSREFIYLGPNWMLWLGITCPFRWVTPIGEARGAAAGSPTYIRTDPYKVYCKPDHRLNSVLFLCLPGRTEKNHKSHQSVYPTSWPGFKLRHLLNTRLGRCYCTNLLDTIMLYVQSGPCFMPHNGLLSCKSFVVSEK